MKKPYKFNEMSNVKCEICNKQLKKNVVERKTTKVTRCYKDEKHPSGHMKRKR